MEDEGVLRCHPPMSWSATVPRSFGANTGSASLTTARGGHPGSKGRVGSGSRDPRRGTRRDCGRTGIVVRGSSWWEGIVGRGPKCLTPVRSGFEGSTKTNCRLSLFRNDLVDVGTGPVRGHGSDRERPRSTGNVSTTGVTYGRAGRRTGPGFGRTVPRRSLPRTRRWE